ncbi:Dual specificity tyrosine-phosphorylation-regulated kinase 3 [Tritrichomonas foetus]|uniref:dual-specificity kinase n=1 Tax=Tritrichomonas foetus TaxID=1144522 RepID=A0A1J4KC07_9EUKA|nr:Dual specificity tyrosine-phosphorylation-regulated kinase 3 [Tritrichomonas foetus]|eukprot:OHT06997.1 Dual specificity tyrosine-phosphorylation-regulated kinase 3 [Tritrichomonas foetus]
MRTVSKPMIASATRQSSKVNASQSKTRKANPKAKMGGQVPRLNLDDFPAKAENKPVPNTSRITTNKSNQARPMTSRVPKSNVLKPTTRKTHVNPIVADGPISPDIAIEKYSSSLNSYEIKEIINFQEIFFIGHSESKISPNSNEATNFGFDDKNHHYRAKIGDHIGFRYEIRAVLGKGAFGQVLRCFDYKTKTYVALKIIVNTPIMQEQGKIEVSILKTLNEKEGHDESCVIKCLDCFVFRNHICVTSEILGSDLYETSRKMRFRPFSISQVKSIGHDILKALEFIHDHNIIHCDMKPENVLLCPGSSQNVKIIDFGSSCKVGEQKYEYIQSRFYRAPEVILGLKYGPAMDIWSFGCIMAEMLLGKPLFAGYDEPEQIEMFLEAFGMPSNELIDKSDRKSYFFDSTYRPISRTKSKKKRRIGGSSLAALTKFNNKLLLDLLAKCFEWDQEKRITATEALNHPFFTSKSTKSSETTTVASSIVRSSNKNNNVAGKNGSNIKTIMNAKWR